jgi:hypothetical protein
MILCKYVKSDGENWIALRIRVAPTHSQARLDDVMRQNGWVRFSDLREKFNRLKQRVAKENPIKFPNWKEVKIPMKHGTKADLPMKIKEAKDVEVLPEAANGN